MKRKTNDTGTKDISERKMTINSFKLIVTVYCSKMPTTFYLISVRELSLFKMHAIIAICCDILCNALIFIDFKVSK